MGAVGCWKLHRWFLVVVPRVALQIALEVAKVAPKVAGKCCMLHWWLLEVTNRIKGGGGGSLLPVVLNCCMKLWLRGLRSGNITSSTRGDAAEYRGPAMLRQD